MGISIKSIKHFYKINANLSYKRITIRDFKLKINATSIMKLLLYLKKLLETDHYLFSLDETSFGVDDLKRYGWGKVG